ncbi:MAG TPA: hypothetical protein PLT70_12110, partial [bacterium]|nr:hypothetical protein [bacterium]
RTSFVFRKGVSKKVIAGIIEKYSFKIARTLDGIEGYFIFKAPVNFLQLGMPDNANVPEDESTGCSVLNI